jgi:hypothetical protein
MPPTELLSEAESEAEPGARLANEPAAAWAAFCAYRDMGPTRSIRAAYRQRSGAEGAAPGGQPSGHWNAWTRDWRWRQRAEEWDRFLDRQARLAQVEEVKAMNRRQVQAFRALQARAIQALAKVRAEDLSPQDIVRWMVEASKGERLALGQVTEAVRSELAGENKITLEVVERIVTTRAEARDPLPPATGDADALPVSEGVPLAALESHGESAVGDASLPADFDLPDERPG